MATTPPRPPRGMRDLLPDAMRRRQFVLDALTEVFQTFGFEPLMTPAVELAGTLFGKYGPDAERLIYRARLHEDEDLALRYDMSVPLARVVAGYPELPRPFRRYQIAPAWRGERPQRGRYREFLQADVDIVGSASMLADAEIITLVVALLNRLGFTNNRTKINNRKLLNAIGRYAGLPEVMLPGLFRSIDKLDKIGLDGVRLELLSVGLPGELMNRQRQGVGRWLRGQADRAKLEGTLRAALGEADPPAVATQALPAYLEALEAFKSSAAVDDAALEAATLQVMSASIAALRACYPEAGLVSEATVSRLLDLLQLQGEGQDALNALESELGDDLAREGIGELRQVLAALDAAGVPEAKYGIDFAMVRGLDYYTGTIFETVVTDPPIGSLTGGGRYDRLIGLFGRDTPAVGTSFGVDRLEDVLEEANLFPASVSTPPAQVLVAQFDAGAQPASPAEAVRFTAELRSAGVATELYFEPDPLGEQIRYALRRRIPTLAILGPDEIAAGTVTLKNLDTQTQVTVPRKGVVAALARSGTTTK